MKNIKKTHNPKPKILIWGTHAATECWLNPERTIKSLMITDRALPAFQGILEEARRMGIKRPEPKILHGKELDKATRDGVHQGIVLDVAPLPELFVQDMISASFQKERACIVMLDQVTDPHNVGAILRSASAFGASGLIMQRKHAPSLTGVLAKTASGAVEHIPVAYEINLSRALTVLQEEGFIAIGLDERGESNIGDIDIPAKSVIVLGAEGSGLRPKVAEHCNLLVRLPTSGAIQSLNVSNATAVALYALMA